MNAELYANLYATLEDGRSAVLIRIIRHRGSVPRGTGSACMIDEQGSLSGSIGGGLSEFKAVEQAKLLLEQKKTALRTFTMTAEEISNEGMICGGSVELFFEPVLGDDSNALELFREVDQLIRSGGEGVLVTRLRDAGDGADPNARMLVRRDGSRVGGVPLPELPRHSKKAHLVEQEGAGDQFFCEPVQAKPALLLFGGGHVSKSVVPIAKSIGFHVTVCDDRVEFANRDRFPDADELIALDYRDAFSSISITGSSYIVVVTRGHGGDKDVLKLLLRSGASPAYIGMIGSTRKRDAIYRALMDDDIPGEMLEQVYSPIGLDIGAQTAEEIAVSIMAEIIRVKARGS